MVKIGGGQIGSAAYLLAKSAHLLEQGFGVWSDRADMKRWLILPCETRAREFDAKLLLGVVAARRGFPSIVGFKKTVDLNLSRFPPGVYVGKSLTARSRHNLLLARYCGHRVAAWDEEGLVWASREVYWRTKVDAPTLNTPELLLAWGDDNARVWREHPDYQGTPIAVTGNPRMDLLLPQMRDYFEQDVALVREQADRFLLLNTNFSRVNHAQPSQNRHLRWLRENRPEDPRGGFAAHKYELYGHFQRLLAELATARRDLHIVVRPHPSESMAPWRSIADQHSNVSVRRMGSAIPWLLAADGLVHNGCTTALEGYALGCPALAYMPVREPRFDHPLPNGLSTQCEHLEGLVDQIDACRRDRRAAYDVQAADLDRQILIAQSVAGFGGQVLASDRICDALEPLLTDAQPTTVTRRRGAGLMLALRRGVQRIERVIPGSANYQPYLAQMFLPVGLDEVRSRVAALASCLGVDPPEVTTQADNVFLLR